jgi:hypothetical protein
MTWVTWRLYRAQWAIALALLAAFAAAELTDGLHMASVWHSLLTSCAGISASRAGSGPSCLDGNIVSAAGNDLRVLSVIVPAIVGMLWGAPLVAHEMETGTAGFAWTQGITRARWLAAKAGILLLSAALWAGAVSALVTWWSGPENAQRAQAFGPNYFDTQGITPIGYAVFAMALGIAAGALLRRTVPAIAVTLGAFIGVRVLFDSGIRQHLMPAVTTVTTMMSTWQPPGISWMLDSGVLNASGQIVRGGAFSSAVVDGAPAGAVPAACSRLIPGGLGGAGRGAAGGPGPQDAGHALASCLDRAGFRQFVTYQPGSRYWAFQGIETGIYVALAAALLAVTVYVIRHRDA